MIKSDKSGFYMRTIDHMCGTKFSIGKVLAHF